MAEPSVADLDIIAGDNWPPVTWRFEEAGVTAVPINAWFALEIQYGYGANWDTYTATSAGELAIDRDQGTVTWNYSEGTSRMLAGMVADYVLRCHTGAEIQTWVTGRLNVRG